MMKKVYEREKLKQIRTEMRTIINFIFKTKANITMYHVYTNTH